MDPLISVIASSWWYLPGITAGSTLASRLLSPAVAWLVGIPFGWRLLAMSLVIPLIVAPAVACQMGPMADRLEDERRFPEGVRAGRRGWEGVLLRRVARRALSPQSSRAGSRGRGAGHLEGETTAGRERASGAGILIRQ